MFQRILQLDKNGWNTIIRIQPEEIKKRFFAPVCVTLCGKSWRRWHLTCLNCRVRRVYYQKVAPRQPVIQYHLSIYRLRNHAVLKGFLLKFLLSIAEVLAR